MLFFLHCERPARSNRAHIRLTGIRVNSLLTVSNVLTFSWKIFYPFSSERILFASVDINKTMLSGHWLTLHWPAAVRAIQLCTIDLYTFDWNDYEMLKFELMQLWGLVSLPGPNLEHAPSSGLVHFYEKEQCRHCTDSSCTCNVWSWWGGRRDCAC